MTSRSLLKILGGVLAQLEECQTEVFSALKVAGSIPAGPMVFRGPFSWGFYEFWGHILAFPGVNVWGLSDPLARVI
jgi:hypothetical protein